MKSFLPALLLILLPLAPSAFAGAGPESSWEEIEVAGLKADFPSHWFDNYLVPVTGVCVEDAQLKTISPVERCVEWTNGKDRRCVRTESVRLSKPLQYLHRYCSRYAAQHECVEFRERFETFPTVFQVGVYRSHRCGREICRDLEFLKQFEVPACR